MRIVSMRPSFDDDLATFPVSNQLAAVFVWHKDDQSLASGSTGAQADNARGYYFMFFLFFFFFFAFMLTCTVRVNLFTWYSARDRASNVSMVGIDLIIIKSGWLTGFDSGLCSVHYGDL